MARHSVTLGLANANELARLPRWYEMAGAESAAALADADVDRVIDAHAKGYLGVATGNTFTENLASLAELPMDWWFLARTRIVALRLDGRTIGMSVMGAHQQLWEYLATDAVMAWGRAGMPGSPEDLPQDVTRFLAAATRVDKIRLVAIEAEHRGRKHGVRLVRHALAMAQAARSVMLYGQFRGPHARSLARFYSRLGFTVLSEDQPLDAFMATGKPGDHMQPAPGERYFVRYLDK